jgi:ElaA protein
VTVPVRCARFGALDAATLYQILQLRVDVFVLAQACPYRDLDGRDTEPETLHLWIEDDGVVIACLRLLDDGDDARIGRVVTAPAYRRQGLAALLMGNAMALAAPRSIILDAQSHLAGWYGRLGFRVDGPEFLEDGIPHTPMRR